MTIEGITGLARRTAVILTLALAVLPLAVVARGSGGDVQPRGYIVELLDPAVAAYEGESLSVPNASNNRKMRATRPSRDSGGKLDAQAAHVREYSNYLEARQADFEFEAAARLARPVNTSRRYQFAINGVAMELTPDEAEAIAQLPMVKSVQPDRVYRPHTDAGPEWVGAGAIWTGQSGQGATRGAGMVIGIIDFGINWEHPSFADPAPDGYNHTNPFGQQLGLCSMSEVECNDKLIGVYDFVTDSPSTPDLEEENTNGRDNNGHGSHVSGIAAGNRVAVQFGQDVITELSGVAPRANIVSYRVCYTGEPPDPEGGACLTSAILDAIDQAIEDGVDVINYSIGTNAFSPWISGAVPRAFLNARDAGIVTAVSAGNEGPNPGTIGSPANAPWVISVGNATHNRVFGSVVENLSGGSAPSPGDLIGASLSGGIGVRPIVHAADFGFPLCGTGDPELQPSCDENQGLSNPWTGNPVFNGEIVVCDRGTYGRVEKGKNLMLAGAGGYILANTEVEGESIVADDHCLPATHLGDSAGDALRDWLGAGDGHQGSISGFALVEDAQFGDIVAAGSSRGPVDSPGEDILKPNVIAPGTDILSAWFENDEFVVIGGTSMSSPHVAGAAALLKALHPDWTPGMIASAIETTSTPELATNETGAPADPHQRGAGRPQLGDAAAAGLFLDVTTSQFLAANPSQGGQPGNLNLPGMVDASCGGICNFSRTVTDMRGGGTWLATPEGFPEDVSVSVEPASFSLGDGASQPLAITLDLRGSTSVGQWVYGTIRLSSGGRPNQYLTVAVFYDAGALPEQWEINSEHSAGREEMNFSGLVPLPDANFTSGGLVKVTTTTETIVQDPTDGDPFDGEPGVFTVWRDVPQGTLWLHARTLASTSSDLDLFVGRDANGNGLAEESELLCESTSPSDLELCDLFTPVPGDYWIIVQNWEANLEQGDAASLESAVIGGEDSSDLVVSGPGIVMGGQSFDLRLAWHNVDALPGERWLGAVGLGTHREFPGNVGVIPVVFNRTGIAEPKSTPLMAGREHRFALAAGTSHDRLFIDIPPGTSTLVLSASGDDADQSSALSLDLRRQEFPGALNSPPFAQLPEGTQLVGSSTGGSSGPSISINDFVPPGRYFVVINNGADSPASVTVSAAVQSSPAGITPHRGLWDFDREIFQGAEWNGVGEFSFLVWYAYDLDGQPTWFIASGPSPTGNIWVADLLRVTNDGAAQQEKRIGRVALTFLANGEVVMSYALDGESGFDLMRPNGPNTCPAINGVTASYTGHWYRGLPGLGGSTVLVYNASQAQVHYLFDASGVPRWVIGAEGTNPRATEFPLLQFDGFCATCTPQEVVWDTVGMVTRSFQDESNGAWTLDLVLLPPLEQSIERTDIIVKLSATLECQ